MHIEIQVALNFVISYLYNKLPRRRVNIFGEELEKALKDKFQGHWYPEKPFKGSAFRCLKTGDPIDAVLERAARESGVPIADILENLPNELSVWVDPGEVSYRIGEKGAVKILYSENSDNQEDNTSADREVNKTFNPEAQCFRPIDAINTSMNSLSLSPKTSPHSGSSPHSASSTSPTYKGSPNPAANNAASGSFMQRTQAPLTFTTATFAQTKFGSTKLKTSSKRTNSSSYRMSPTEFSNYIKQRAMQQQLHHGHGPAAPQANHFGPIGPVSPAKSQSPNPLSLDPFYFPNMAAAAAGHNIMGYAQFNGGHRNLFDGHGYHGEGVNGGGNGVNGGNGGNGGIYGGNAGGHNKFSAYLEPHGFYGLGNQMPGQHQQAMQQGGAAGGVGGVGGGATVAHNGVGGGKHGNEVLGSKDGAGNNCNNTATNITITVSNAVAGGTNGSNSAAAVSPAPGGNGNGNGNGNANGNGNGNANGAGGNQESSSKLIDGLNAFYSSNSGSYQQLLVAN